MGLKGLKDHAGRRIHKVTVLHQLEDRRVHVVGIGEETTTPRMWACRCDCGATFTILHASISDNAPAECKACARNNPKTKYKQSKVYIKQQHSAYNSWYAMIRRCTSPKHVNYKNYGGRGITVCEDWLDFDNFAKDMGERPLDHSIDRIDVNLGYSKNNCRWATAKEQATNTRRSSNKKNIY